MFTEKRVRLVKHYDEDRSFCKKEGAINNYQRKLDKEMLNRIYQARDAEVGPARNLMQAAINELKKHLMQRSSIIMQHTTLLSQILELSFDDIPGVFYFTGGGMAKSPQLPSNAYWVGNRFNLSHLNPNMCRVMIWYKNTDEELFYKHLGFAYITSNHPETSGAGKENMLNDFGYASEIFRYHYETPEFKNIRNVVDTYHLYFQELALNEQHRLINQAYYYRHEVYPSNPESNKSLLFDGHDIYPYPGKHPYTTCANYFDLSRVDPDARYKIIYFFPGHEKVLYYDYGFAYLVSTKVNTPGATRAETIKRFHNPIFANYYAHQVWRTYDIKYPQRWELEMAQVNYDWAIEKAKYDAKHKKHMAIVKSIAGIGLGSLASMLVPGLGSQILTALARGAVFGGVSSGVGGGNIVEGTFKGAFFAGIGHYCKVLEIPEVMRVATIAGISAHMNDENILKSALIAIGAEVVAGQLGISSEEVLKKAFVTSTISSLLGGQNLGNALMSGAIGTIGALSQQVGGELGNGIKDTIQEDVIEKPKKRLAITNGSNDDKLNLNNERSLVLAYNKYLNEPKQKNSNKQLKKINDYFSKPPKKQEDLNLWETAVRAFNGDKNAQLEMRHRMPRLAAVFDGIREGTERGEVIRNVGLTMVGVGTGAAVTLTVTKETGKLLFAYKLYKKSENIMKNGPTDRIQHEALKTQLRQNMEKPVVENKKLFKVVDELYRKNAEIGSGSTADAYRYTAHTGKLVKGSDHIKKTHDTIKFLENWIENNPTASSNDRSVAENILLDMKDAIGEKLWYSQTKPPKY
jgi:hypothetical protein